MDEAVTKDLRAAISAFLGFNRDVVLAKSLIGPGADQEEAVHELRVATKKIRTAYRLVQAMAPEKFRQKRAIAELRVLFRAAGGLREAQVHQQVVDGYELMQVAFYRKVSKALRVECRVATPIYEVQRKRFRKESFEEPFQQIRGILKSISEEEAVAITVAFVRARLTAVHEVMPANYEPELIHQARIYLKEAMYLIGLLHAAGYKDDFSAEWLAAAKQAAELAGEWHDREVFYQWLQIQLRPQGPLSQGGTRYALLLQDLHAHTKSLVKRFREAIEPLKMATISGVEAG